MFYILIFIVSFLISYIKCKEYIRMIQVASTIPGFSLRNLISISWKLLMAEPYDFYKYLLNFKTDFKDIAKIWIGPKLMIFLYHPADIELILSSNVHIDKSLEYKMFKPWFGNGLLISTGPKWKHHRKMIAPTFHQSILKTFVPKMYENSIRVCKDMEKEIGKTFDAHDYMSSITVDILLETAMGYDLRKNKTDSHRYAKAVMKLCDILHRRHYKFWLRPDFLFKRTSLFKKHDTYLQEVRNLTEKVVLNKKMEALNSGLEHFGTTSEKVDKTREEEPKIISGYNYGTAVRDDLDDNDENDIGEKKRLSFLEQLTVNAQHADVDFTEQEVQDQVNTIMFEGHDTTAAGSSFALCLMGIHQDIQDKVIKEIDDIFQETDRECTFADTLEMKYLERVIMETLRMYPPVPMISRELKEEVPLASGNYSLPVGTTVVIIQGILHRRPNIFPNPDVFDPDNFLPEKCKDRHYYSYIPFSAGPRSCVGRKFAILKLKILLSTIFRKYRVYCDMKEGDFKLQGDIILKIADGFKIRLIPR